MKMRPVWGRKSMQNWWKIDFKWTRVRLSIQELSQAAIWGLLGASWLQEGGSWAILSSKLGPKIGQNRSQERSEMWSIFWWIWRSIFEAIWSHLGSQTPPKMKPSWLQNRCKLGCWFESCFVMDFGWIFIDFLLQHSMAEVAKIVNSFYVFYRFLIFWLLGFWVDFGIDFW